MRVIDALNVNDAYRQGLELLLREGVKQQTRNGIAYSLATPLALVYRNPRQRVLFDARRDANPFFHLFESLWMLSGRNDARWLDQFVSDFSSRFAEPADGTQHGAYGFRWRRHFDVEGGGNPNMPDQLDTVVRILRANPGDRRAVIQMWDPVADLGKNKRDVPCNVTAVPRIVFNRLDLTVLNRSNDFVWGMTGANAVHFSILQEYLAGRIGVAVGQYTQISTNAHVYAQHAEKLTLDPWNIEYPDTQSIGDVWGGSWDADLRSFLEWTDGENLIRIPDRFANSWFDNTAVPLYSAHRMWKLGARQEAFDVLAYHNKVAPDWREAALAWMQRRLDKEKKNAG